LIWTVTYFAIYELRLVLRGLLALPKSFIVYHAYSLQVLFPVAHK
jgi:hypothetical protein